MKYMTSGSAAADLFAAESGVIAPGEVAVISTGETLPDLGAGLCGMVLPRSGLAAKFGVTVLNSPGLIDPDYQGEIKVILINHGKEDFTYLEGMRIAQLAAMPYTRIWGVETSSSSRGEGGLGSTDK